jgi:UDP-N-acetylglucosamine 2-epimerase (non-hydrolysing)
VAPDRIHVTGNTGIDAVLHIARGLDDGSLTAPAWEWLDARKKLITVTSHRRENFGQGMENLCEALLRLARRPGVQIAFPVHPNPNVQSIMTARLAAQANIKLLEPLDYVPFVDLMRRSTLLITDSGGVQEEGPSLGKPILVLREKTERPEAVEAGTVELVGTNPELIVSRAANLLEDEELRMSKSRVHNPYGDGLASGRISNLSYSFLSK